MFMIQLNNYLIYHFLRLTLLFTSPSISPFKFTPLNLLFFCISREQSKIFSPPKQENLLFITSSARIISPNLKNQRDLFSLVQKRMFLCLLRSCKTKYY